MPDTFQLGGYDLITSEPYEPLSGSSVLREQLRLEKEKQQQNAKLREQAELDQHLQRYGDDPISRAWGEAEFRLQRNESALKKRQQAEDEIGGQYDDPVAKAWAIASQRLKGTDQPAVRQAQADVDAMESMKRRYQQSAALDRVTPDNAFVREAVGGVLNAAPDFVSIAARLTGNGEAADELNRQSQEMQQARGELRETDWSPYLSRQFGGAVQSVAQMAGTPGGAFGKIGGAALMSGNQALTTAEDAGLTGAARLRYAGTQALLEGGIAAIFQKAGLGGVESRMAGQAVAAQTWKQLGKQLGKDALQEVPEEVMTAVLQDVSSKLEGVTDAGFGDMVSNATDAAVQALLMSGLTNTPNAARLFIQSPSRENYKALPPEMKLPGKPENYVPPGDQRKALAEQMRQGPAAQAPTPEEQAAIDEENRLTALKSPGAQPDFVPPPDPVAKPRGEVIQDQGRLDDEIAAKDADPASAAMSDSDVAEWLASKLMPQGGPATESTNPDQGGSNELQDEERQGLLTPDEPRSQGPARQQMQQWLRMNPEPTPPSPRYDGRAAPSVAPSDPGSSPGAAVDEAGLASSLNEKTTDPGSSTKVLYPSGDGQQGSVAEKTVQPASPQDKRLAPYIEKLKKDYPPDYFESEDDGISYEDRIRAIAERDADEDEANAEEKRLKDMTAEERVRENGSDSWDRRDVAQERFAEYGIQPLHLSEGSTYFTVGGMKVRFSDHDPSQGREAEFGAAGVDVNTGDSARDSTDNVKPDPDDIRSVVDRIVKKYAPGKFKGRQPENPAASLPAGPSQGREVQPEPNVEGVPPVPVSEQGRDKPLAETIAPLIRLQSKPVNDIHGEPTGWLMYRDAKSVSLVHPTENKIVPFYIDNQRSGTEQQRRLAEAQAYAIDNPIEQGPKAEAPPQGDLVIKPVFQGKDAPVPVSQGPEADASPLVKETHGNAPVPGSKEDYETQLQSIRDRRAQLTAAHEKLQEDLTAQKRVANRSRSAAAKQKMQDIEAEWSDAKEQHQAEMNKLAGESLKLQETHPYAKEQGRLRAEAMKPKQAEQAARDAAEQERRDQHDWQVVVDRGGHEKVLSDLESSLRQAAGNTKRMSDKNKIKGESAERSIQRNIDRTKELAAKFAQPPVPVSAPSPPVTTTASHEGQSVPSQGSVVETPTKQPWQMSPKEYAKSRVGTKVEKTPTMGRAETITADHRGEVRKAFAQGQDVPWSALEPYLDDFKREGQGPRIAERVKSDVEQGRAVPESVLKRFPTTTNEVVEPQKPLSPVPESKADVQHQGQDAGEPTIPKYERTTPAPGTPERAEIEARAKGLDESVQTMQDEYDDVDKKYQKAGYGTKLKESLSKRLDKLRDKISQHKEGNDYDGMREKKRLMWLEDVATQSQVKAEGSTSTGKDEANALAARRKIISDIKTGDTNGELKQLREQVNELALNEAKRHGLTGEDAEKAARSAALYIMDFPGSRSLVDLVSGEVRSLEAMKSHEGATKSIEALEHLDSYRKKHYRDQLDKYNAGTNERVIQQATQENKDKAAAAKTAKGIQEAADLEEFRKSWSDTVPNRTTVADVLNKEGYINAKVGDKPAITNARWAILSDALPKTLKARAETTGESARYGGRVQNVTEMFEMASKGAVPLTLVGHETLKDKPKKKEKGLGVTTIGRVVLTDGEYTIGVDEGYYNYLTKNGFEFRGRPDVVNGGRSGGDAAIALYKNDELAGIIMPVSIDGGKNETLDSLKQRIEQARSAAPKNTLSERAAKARQEVSEAAQTFKKSIGGTTPNIGSFSPESLKAFTTLTVKILNAGALTFAEYSSALATELGDMAESLRPLMRQMWPKIAAKQGLDPSTEESPKPEKVEASGLTLFGEQGPPIEPPVDDAETPDDAGGVPNPTATKHADSDATREAMGMPPRKIHDPEGHSFEDLGERARKAPSQEIDELIAELADNPRTLDGRGYENALLLRRATELNNQYKKAVREKQEARDAGDSVKVVERDKAKQIAIEQRRMLADILDELGSRAGSELNARKMMMNDDYSVAHMEMEYADEHDGEAPSDAQVEEWAKWEQQVKDLQEQVTQERAGREAAEQALALEKAHNAAIDRAEADKKAKEKSSVIQKGIERGRKHLEDGFKLLGQMRGKVYSIEGAAVDLTKALTEIVRGYAEIGVFSFADAMKRFTQRVGTEAESMRSDFKQAWDAHFSENGIGELQDMIDPENPQSIGAIAKRLHQFVIERDNLGKSAEDRDRAVAGVHELLGEAMDDLTLEQTARILSGKDEPTRKLSEEEIRTEHRAQLQILEDIRSWKNNERPNAIQERRPDSDEQRKLRRIRAEAKKNAKVPDVRDPAQQLQSALDSAKTSTKNRIADLNEAIKTGQRILASKTVLIPDAELVSLRAERDALQAAYDEAFGKKEMSDEQRAAMLEKALDRQIAQLETDIPKGILYPPAMQPKQPITNPDIAAKKAHRDALVARRDELRLLSPETAQRELEAREKALTAQWEKLKAEKEAGKLWNDKEHKAKPTNERIAALEEAIGLTLAERDYDRKNSPEYQAREMAYYERVLAGRVQFWQNRLNEGDFAPKAPKEPRKLTESQMTLQHELEKAKDKFANEQEKWRIENRTATQKVKDFAGHAWDFWRDIKSTGELSPFGRQGLMYVAGHWLRAGKAIAESIGTVFATDPEHALSRINQKILDRPNAKAGLYKDVPFATKLNDRTSQQEVMIGEWAKRIPLFGSMVKRFGTAGEAFLNIARADMMDSMLATLGVEPNRVSKDEVKFLANAAGVLTGRGNLDPGTAKVLNRVLYSSLFTMSRIETVIGRPLWKQGGSARARMAIAKEYVRSAVGLYLMDMALRTALMALPGDDEEDEVTIETNTTSTDFGKLKAGRTRIDTMGGLQQTLVLLERLRQGQKTKNGVVETLGSTFGGDDENDLLSKFARSRLHPTLAMVWDRWTGENAVGEKVRPLTDYDPRTSAGLKNIALENGPMAYGDMLAAADELGYPRGLLAATAAFFGSGLSTYGNTKAEDQRFLTLKATGTLTTEDKVKATKGAMQGYTAAEFVKQGVPKAQQALENARTPEQKRLAEKALRDAQAATESALAADVAIKSARKELLKIKSWDEKVKLYSQAYKERNGSIASPAFIEGVKRLPHANGPRKISPALRQELLRSLDEKFPRHFNKDRTINQEWRKLKLAIEAM